MTEPAVSAPLTPARAVLIKRHLDALYQVSQVLSHSISLQDILEKVLEVLHAAAGMQRGVVSLLDPGSGELMVGATQSGTSERIGKVRYRLGEGVMGSIMQTGETIVVRRIADESRFLHRLRLYAPEAAFIGVPIRVGDERPMGVLAAQPTVTTDPDLLADQARFLKMVANLLAQNVRRATAMEQERCALADERDRLRQEVRGGYRLENVVGNSRGMRRAYEQVRQVAKWQTTVLIRGETGTGKELIAHAIHYNSSRANGAFIKLNCAALPDNLLETELFGHEKGAFTGAVAQRKGRFEQADGGTIFLDEIGEISHAFQAKLLRVLQEGEFERVGGNRTLKVDVRVIAATNRNLEEEVEHGDFREDLYYRLNVMPIFIPPLRARLEDMPDLAHFLVDKIARVQGRPLSITDSAIRMLMRHDWPGNVRELENCLERAAIMSETGAIDLDAINLTGLEDRLATVPMPNPSTGVALDDPDMDERERVIAALERAGWVQAKAARLLGMTPRQIAYRIQTLKIRMRQL